jgi:hypothetical protein
MKLAARYDSSPQRCKECQGYLRVNHMVRRSPISNPPILQAPKSNESEKQRQKKYRGCVSQLQSGLLT